MVSVIIPTYNSARYIKESVDSVLAQTFSPLEVIVVDDGSTDNTKEILSSYIETKKIIYLKKENGGPASARNLGISKAKGEFIAFLDADDIWLPEKLTKQISLFNDLDIGIVYTKRFFLNTKQLGKEILYRGKVTKELINDNFITNSSVILRKNIFAKIGFFNEKQKCFAIEDYDFWLRASVFCKFDYVDSGLVYYRIHDKQISKVNSLITRKNLIKLYFELFFNSKYSEFKGLILFKILQNIKGFLISKIKYENSSHS